MISKITAPISDQDNPTESVSYIYNLQGRLESVTTVDAGGASAVEYKYNSSGLRIAKIVDGIETEYLIDSSNHTGYAQVLEEWSGGSTPDITYTIGDDVIAQTDSSNNTDYLLYDGHGSTRQLLDSSGVTAVYDYDSYGIGTQSDESAGATSLQYTGEQRDAESGDYYLRARYYSPSNGRFNRIDPYSGNMQDPQSLHKYLYCHANPVNNIDPTGMMSLTEVNVSVSTTNTLNTLPATTMASGNAISAINSIMFLAAVGFTLAGLSATALLVGLALSQAAINQKYEVEIKPLLAPMTASHIEANQLKTKVVSTVLAMKEYVKQNGIYSDVDSLPIYLVFEAITPDIYQHTVDSLVIKPIWSVLHYFGPDSIRNRENRQNATSEANSNWRSRISGNKTSPDEFPYASTDQGGWGARVEPVLYSEQVSQRVALSAFYKSRLNNTPGHFLVVPMGSN